MSQPLNVGMFHATLPSPGRKLGGVEVFVQRMADHLVEAGHACTVYSLDRAPMPGSQFAHVQLFPRWERFFRGKLARWMVLPFALNFAPWRRHDILVLHGDDWFYAFRRTPTFRIFHGSALFEARSATSRKRKLMQGLIHYGEKLASKLCTVSGSVGTETAKMLGCSYVVDCGIDASLHRPGERSDKPRILFVGTWEGRKQGSLTWKTFVESIYPVLPEATLDFVADRPPPQDHPGVKFHRFPSDQALAQLYREAWLFLYPSTYEGFGIPYLEALASGTPVVCLPNEGALRLLSGCPAARLCSEEELSKSALDVLSQGKNAFQDQAVAWTSRYGWPEVIDRYAAMFREVLHA